MLSWSEKELQSELDLPWRRGRCSAADLSCTPVVRCNAVCVVGTDCVVRVVEGRRVEKVKQLRAELQLGVLVNRETLEYREAERLCTGPVDLVSHLIAQ